MYFPETGKVLKYRVVKFKTKNIEQQTQTDSLSNDDDDFCPNRPKLLPQPAPCAGCFSVRPVKFGTITMTIIVYGIVSLTQLENNINNTFTLPALRVSRVIFRQTRRQRIQEVDLL